MGALAVGYTALTRRWQWRALLTCAAVGALLYVPFPVQQWRLRGDPLYVSNLQARAFRNYEFHDLPGFPTSADMDRDR